MSARLHEPARSIPVRRDCDVVVAGGGIAGVAAAVAAARNGASTCLLEKEYALGGLATLGLVIAYLPICDGMGNLVSAGLAEELLLLSTYDGSATLPECWRPGGDRETRKKQRYFLEFNPASYLLELEDFVIRNDVSLLYDARVVGVNRRGSLLDAVIVESKSGREAITCRAVVDATGDADICYFAGEETASLGTNSASGWYYASGPEGNRLHKLYRPFDPTGETLPPGTERGFAGDSMEEVTAHVLASRSMIRDHLERLRSETSHASLYPFLVPTFPGFRMTRRLNGAVVMDAEDRKEYPDSIGLIGNWRRPGPVYSIPLRVLQGVKCANLFAAGRCVSARRHGWDMTRVIPACAVTGEAAGTAAALCRGQHHVRIEALQERLLRQNVKLWMKQIDS